MDSARAATNNAANHNCIGGTAVIEDAPLVTLRRKFQRPTPEMVKAFDGIPAGYVVDALGGTGALDPAIKPVIPERARFHGVAVTCDAGPSDNLAVFAALDVLQPGDVIVATTDGYRTDAIVGDLLLGMMKNNGAAAFVTDGTVRDLVGIRGVDLPCFATGVTPNSPARNGPGTVGLPIAIGGARVDGGDIVVGDIDGVVVVPYARINAVIAKLADIKRLEADLDAKVRGGLKMPEFVKPFFTNGRIREVD
jgi:4-hydroxy-4-methyl-2-oxoglutarate aldolase